MPRKISRKLLRNFVFSKAQLSDIHALVGLGKKLWPQSKTAELRAEFTSYVYSKKDCLFIVRLNNEDLIAFIHGSLRFEYVEGADSSPVGYIEGLYVKPAFRRCGLARDLVHVFEQWARDKRCSVFASDTELNNAVSQRVHRALGYQVAIKVVHFIKKLK